MSTRHSIFYNENLDAGVTVHIYRECVTFLVDDIRLEIEVPYRMTNVPWPSEAFDAKEFRLIV